MGQWKSVLVLILFVSSSLAGCLESSVDEAVIDFVVEYESDSGVVIETYVDGERISLEEVEVEFDFSKTTSSRAIETYGLESMDGTETITVDAGVASALSYAFDEHGIHNVTLFAVDASGVKTSQMVSIRVDLRIDWSEAKTNDPAVLPFNPTPNNGGIHPIAIEIESTVENPSLIDGIGGGGQTVEFSWSIVDELDDTCQSKGGTAEDGSEDTWQTIHFNTYLLHELRIIPEEGQDYLNIQQTVSVLYSSD